MSNKTLHIKQVGPIGGAGENEIRVAVLEATPTVAVFTEDQLRDMLRDLQVKNGTIPIDTTVDLPIGPTPAHLVADKSVLPPLEERTSAPLQAPAARRGSFSINGIPVLGSPIGDIDPRTGAFYTQVGPRPKTMISPPPSRRFDGR